MGRAGDQVAEGRADRVPTRRLTERLNRRRDGVSRRRFPRGANRFDRRTRSEHRGQSRLEVRKRPWARDLGGIDRSEPRLGRQTLQRAGSRERERPRGARRRRRHQRAEGGDVGSRLATLGHRPRRDHDRSPGTGHTPRLLECPPRARRVLKRIEADDRVKRIIPVGERLQVTLGELAIRHALGGDRQQRRCRIEAADDRAALGGKLSGEAGAATGVKQLGTVADPDPLEDRLIKRPHLRLHRAPLASARAPQIALDSGRTAGNRQP